jgi:RNA polymerase sigma-70 factor, ECF subfamily
LNRHSEGELIALLKEGREEAFHRIFQQYYRPLTLFAMKYVGDVEEAKEITQEFFIRIWTKHRELNITLSLKIYLYRGVRNACLNYLDANKVAQKRLRDYQQSSFSNDNPLEKILVAEQEELLMQVIESLPEKCKEIFFLSRMEKLSNQAIADKLQISIKTVEGQMSKALRRLREILLTIVLFLIAA